MKRTFRIGVLAAAVAATLPLVGCGSSGGSRQTGEAAGSSLPDLVAMLSGSFRGSSPGNQLALNFSTLGARVGTRFDLFVTAAGRYRDRNVRRAGLLRLETQGQSVRASYIPHFDATVTALSREASRFSDEEVRSACGLYFYPSGDGYGGETPGATTCAQAIPGAAGKWTVEVSPAGIRIRNVASGETLRFAKERRPG